MYENTIIFDIQTDAQIHRSPNCRFPVLDEQV